MKVVDPSGLLTLAVSIICQEQRGQSTSRTKVSYPTSSHYPGGKRSLIASAATTCRERIKLLFIPPNYGIKPALTRSLGGEQVPSLSANRRRRRIHGAVWSRVAFISSRERRTAITGLNQMCSVRFMEPAALMGHCQPTALSNGYLSVLIVLQGTAYK